MILPEFEILALKCLHKENIKNCRLVVIDEIGKMESFSSKFQSLVRSIFDSEVDIVATIPVKHDNLNLVKEIVNRNDVEIIEVTKANRDSLKDELLTRF